MVVYCVVIRGVVMYIVWLVIVVIVCFSSWILVLCWCVICGFLKKIVCW